MTPKELDDYAEIMKQQRIIRLKLEDAEIELSPLAFMPAPETPKIGAAHGNPTDDELLMWSTADLPDIAAHPPEMP